MAIDYIEYPSGKKRRTRGKFVGWVRGGEFGLVYAVVQRKASTLYIPRMDITVESRAGLPAAPDPPCRSACRPRPATPDPPPLRRPTP